MEAWDWFKIEKNIGATSAIFFMRLNPRCVRLFNKTRDSWI